MNTHEEGVSSNWAGVQIKARLSLHCLKADRLRGEFQGFVYGHVHHQLPGGWNSNLPVLQYKPYPGMQKPFEVIMSGGLVKEVLVSKDTTPEEENLLKGILGNFQYDTSERSNSRHEDKSNGVFRKMEREVSGKCETLYAVNPLGLDILQSSPYLAPFVNVKKMKQENKKYVVDIRKTKNYGKCNKRVAYHFGVPEESSWENSAGNLMKRSTVSRIIADLNNNTIYSSYTTDQIRATPLIGQQYANEAEVMSSANVTLIAVEQSMENPKPLELRSAGDLIYSIGSKKQRNQRVGGSSSSSSSSSEEDRHGNNKGGDQASHPNSISKHGEQNHKDQGDEQKPARRQRRY
ncbi:vitellogenin-like [Arctopsyche grandis]|uniref:vitellogenin-like n=1 Tax=Arctopsyche grandis TaxID=121162 RepID=UPI00406D69D5